MVCLRPWLSQPTFLQHGNGIRVFSSGNQYEGEWQNDLMHGHGMFVGTDGHRYGGGFMNGALPAAVDFSAWLQS
jgi:hypothetical protein